MCNLSCRHKLCHEPATLLGLTTESPLMPPGALLQLCHCQVLPCAVSQGLMPRLMRIPPGQAIVWAVSDQITGYFERRRMDAAVAV